jgi:predicted dehydrogenase
MQDRRAFLKAAGTVAAAGSFINWNPAAMGANEKVTLALIGGRNQGRGVALRAIQTGAAEFKTFCDLDPAILEKTGADLAAAQGRKPGFESRFERVLEDKEIDAVVIAVPDPR